MFAGDTTTYWMNTNYTNCLDSGSSIYDCQNRNIFIMLYIEPDNKNIIIESSVLHFGSMTCRRYAIKQDSINKSSYTITKDWPFLSSCRMVINQDTLTINDQGNILKFTKYKIEKIKKDITVDMGSQVGIYSSRSLLQYSVEQYDNNALILSNDSLVKYIKLKRVSLYCSDDYFYIGMAVKGTDSQYLLQYYGDTIKLFKTKGSARFQKFDFSTHTDMEILRKKK